MLDALPWCLFLITLVLGSWLVKWLTFASNKLEQAIEGMKIAQNSIDMLRNQRDQATHERDHYASILAEMNVKVEPGSDMNKH